MRVDPKQLDEAYRQADRQLRLKHSKVGCVVALVLVPAGITLDYMVYPELLFEIFVIRMVCDLLVAGVLALHYHPMAQRHVTILVFTWPIIIDVAICLMIYLSEGAASPYYAGLNLVLLGVTFLLPLRLSEALAIGLATIGIYIIAVLAGDASQLSASGSVFFNNLYFLTLTVVLSSTASYFNGQRRFSEFRLQYELDIRNKELAKLDQLKSNFMANVSHELRTPLTAILAPLDDLLSSSKTLPGQVREVLQMVERNGLRLLRLVNELLDVLKLEEGRADLKTRVVPVNAIVKSVVDSLRHMAQTRGLSLEVICADEELYVLAAENALEKIVTNLVGNAIKFTDAGGRITAHIRRDSRGNALLSVEDTGAGISAEALPYIFDRFAQADASATRAHQGTGLGLALVKELTEHLGGTIEVDSREHHGTRFTVRLPLSQQPAEKPEAADRESDALTGLSRKANLQVVSASAPVDETEQAAESATAPAANRRVPGRVSNARLVIADDEPDVLDYLRRTLSEDYSVKMAMDGATALRLIRETVPDLVVLDIMMPKLSGLDLCREIKRDNALAHTKIVLLTARIDQNARLAALDLGADDFLVKPFSWLEVKTRIRNLLTSAKLEQQLIQSEKLNALGGMAAGLLHEINNPLNYMLTALEILKRNPEFAQNEEIGDTLEDIRDGAKQIQSITTDLKAFAYPGTAAPSRQCNLNKAVQQALRFTARELGDVQVSVEEGGDVLAPAPEPQIIQVLVNLITNAAYAMRDTNGKQLILRVYKTDAGDAVISVADNGEGIPDHARTRLFDPFFTTRDVGEGTGLGLSVCHTIVSRAGGVIEFESKPGETVFYISLPTTIDGEADGEGPEGYETRDIAG